MTKVQQKSEKISAFGGIFFVLDIFDRILSSVIDSHLRLRSKLIGYQYSEIIRAVFSVFCCGGDLARLRHIIASTAVFTCNNDGIMEIISLPPFSPLNRGIEGVFLTSDIRHQPSSGDERRQLFLLLHRESALHRGHGQHDVAPHHLCLFLHRRQLLVGTQSRVFAHRPDIGINHLWSLRVPTCHDLPNRSAPVLRIVGAEQLKRCPQSILQGFKLGKVRVRRRLHLPLPINFLTLNNVQRIIVPHSSC